MPTLVKNVGRKSDKPKPGPPVDPDRKPMALQIRGSTEWKSWVDRLATFEALPLASLVERALRQYARGVNFTDEPPKR